MADKRFERHQARVPIVGCWLWTAAVDKDGYGLFKLSGRMVRAHRFAYEQAKGPIPHGLTLDHLCRVRCCVNPAHLEVVTVRENTLRGNGPAGRNARKTHCKQGHPYTESNTYQRHTERERICKTCAHI